MRENEHRTSNIERRTSNLGTLALHYLNRQDTLFNVGRWTFDAGRSS